MKKFIFSILFICLSVLTGCSTLRVDYKGPDKGMVILTLTGNKEDPITDYVLRLRKKDKSASGGVFYLPHSIFRRNPRDFEEATYHGSVTVLKLEPSEYEVFNFIASKASGIFYTAKEDFSAPFVVKEGEVIYIGEYWFASIKGTDFLGMRTWKFYITLADKSVRDIPLAMKKEPTIRAHEVKVQIPDGERFGN